MMYLDFEANSEKEATQLALESLGLTIDEVRIESLTSGKKSFFGLGKKEKAKIRVYYKEKNEANEIINTIKILISKIDKNSVIEIESGSDNRYILKIESTESGRLIGKNGRTLGALQTIINSILQKYENKYKIVVDVEDYNYKIQKKILFQAKSMAKKVLRFQKPVTLDPLNPFLRRLIHLELRKFRGIETKSYGEGKDRTITISPTSGENYRRNR